MLKRYDRFALRHPLGATSLFLGLLIVLAMVAQGWVRGWDRYLDHVGYLTAAAAGAGLPMYFSYRQRSKNEPS